MASQAWRELRATVIARDGSCVLCGAVRGLECHHRRYPRRWADDRAGNLVTLCDPCHHEVERMLRKRKKTR